MAAVFFDHSESRVIVRFSEPVQQLNLTLEQAFYFWDHLLVHSMKLSHVELEEFSNETQEMLQASVTCEGTYTVIRLSRPESVWLLPYSACQRLAVAIRESAYKNERVVKGLFPSIKDVERFEEFISEGHKIFQHPVAPEEFGMSQFTKQPFLSRFIRKGWDA